MEKLLANRNRRRGRKVRRFSPPQAFHPLCIRKVDLKMSRATEGQIHLWKQIRIRAALKSFHTLEGTWNWFCLTFVVTSWRSGSETEATAVQTSHVSQWSHEVCDNPSQSEGRNSSSSACEQTCPATLRVCSLFLYSCSFNTTLMCPVQFNYSVSKLDQTVSWSDTKCINIWRMCTQWCKVTK